MDTGGNGRLRFGDFEFDSESGKLFREGRPVKIQPQPLRVLGVLIESAGEIVSREQLRTRIWGDATFVEFDQGLNYCIRQIRRRFARWSIGTSLYRNAAQTGLSVHCARIRRRRAYPSRSRKPRPSRGCRVRPNRYGGSCRCCRRRLATAPGTLAWLYGS